MFFTDDSKPLSEQIAQVIDEHDTLENCPWIPNCTRDSVSKNELQQCINGNVTLQTPDFTGLAWSHYFGYYYLVLKGTTSLLYICSIYELFSYFFSKQLLMELLTKCFCLIFNDIGLKERIIDAEEYTQEDWNVSESYRLFHRMIAIIPMSGNQDISSLAKYDEKIKNVVSKTENVKGKPKVIKAEFYRDMAGFPEKDYSNPLFYIEKGDMVCYWIYEIIDDPCEKEYLKLFILYV